MPRNTNTNGHNQPFEGFGSPNYTQVPDELFDQLMPQLPDAELRVLLYVVRRTFGFKRESDNISLKQMVDGITTGTGRVLDRGTGLSKATVARALNGLKDKGIILAVRNRSSERGDEATTYRLRFKGETGDTPRVSPARQGGVSHQQDTPVSHQRDTQYTGRQETEDISKLRKAHAKKSDRTDEAGEQPSVSDQLVTDQSVSHSTSRAGETDHPVKAAVLPSDELESPIQHTEPDPARTRVLSDSMPSGTGADTSFEKPGEGFERLRETAAKIRAEVQQRQETGQQEDDRLTRSVSAATSSGMLPLASVLPTTRGRPPGSREDRDHIASYLADFRHELGDEAPLSSSVTRALNIFSRAHIPPDRWADCLYQARSITKERSAQITKKRSETATGFAAKNRAPFYFAVLEDLCGLKPPQFPLLPQRQQP